MINKQFAGMSNEDIADAFILPQKLTKKQGTSAALELAAARKKRQEEMTEADKLTANLFQLKFQLEDYIKNEGFDAEKTFGYFLKKYLHLGNKKRNEFAAEIGIHETLLSQLINNHREPGNNIIIRLELHSSNVIPAAWWYRLVEKEKEYFIQTNRQLRKNERKFVKKRLAVSL